MTSGKTTKITGNHTYGLSLRILKGFLEVNGYTNNLSRASLLDLAAKLAATFNDQALGIKFLLKEEPVKQINSILRRPSQLSNDQKLNYLSKAYEAVKDFSPEIIKRLVISVMKNKRCLLPIRMVASLRIFAVTYL